MKKLLFAFSLLTVTHCFANIADDPWPKKLQEFPLEGDSTTIKDFKITAKESANQEAAGSGGAMYDITIQNTKTGEKRLLEDQSIGIVILDFYHGWPQLEIWGRGGGGSYSRSLYRFEKGAYAYVRTDEFTVYEFNSKNKSITTTMPRSDDTLYFVETRIPEAQQGAAANPYPRRVTFSRPPFLSVHAHPGVPPPFGVAELGVSLNYESISRAS
jgi:hypothetical protein